MFFLDTILGTVKRKNFRSANLFILQATVAEFNIGYYNSDKQ